MKTYIKILSSFFLLFVINVANTEELTDIKITTPVMDNAIIKNEAIESINTKNAIDGGDLLQNINGVNTIRRGGHGLDAVIRGQSDQRLTTLLDGAMVYGACSSKMDPASTYVNIENYDTITVIKGAQSVMFGAGGSGGVVSFDRVTEPLPFVTKNKGGGAYQPNKYKFGQTFDSNSEAMTTIGDVQIGLGDKTFVRFNGSYSDANDYETGTGIKPKTGFRTHDYAIVYGWRTDNNSKVEFVYDNNSQENIEFAGLLMDIVYSYTDIYNFKYHSAVPMLGLDTLNFELYQSDMDHLMDNYTARSTSERGSEMKMKTPAASDTYGGRLIGTLGKDMRVGIDYEKNRRDAEQNMMISGTNYHLTYLWPGVEIEKLGLFMEKDKNISPSGILTYGLRYDMIEADATMAADDPGSDHALQVTANSLFTTYYGVNASKRDFDNLSGFIRYSKSLDNDSRYYYSFSRSAGSPDATELFNTKTSMAMAAKYQRRHIGNPTIKTEKHNAFEFGYKGNIYNIDLDGSVYMNNVSDYITPYRVSTNSDETLDSDTNDTRLYKNINARLWGYELSLKKALSPNFAAILNLNYTRGDDRTQNRPLAQITPLTGNFTLDYTTTTTNYGLRVRFADTQDNVDTRVIDVGKTPGYTVYDVYVGFEPTPDVRLAIGMSNITDKRYATHLNVANQIDSTAARVDEAGRSIWGSLILDF